MNVELYLRNIQGFTAKCILLLVFAHALHGTDLPQDLDCDGVFCLDSLTYQGYIDLFQSHENKARRTFCKSIRQAINLKDTSEWIRGLVGLSTYYSEKGQLDSAYLISDSSVVLSRVAKLQPYYIFALDHKANLIAQKGQMSEALELLEDILIKAHDFGDPELTAKCHTSSGFIFLGKGQYEEAFTSYVKSLELLEDEEQGDPFMLRTKALLGQGIVFSVAKKFNESLESYTEALEQIENSNHPETPSLRLSLLRLVGQHYIDQNQLLKADSIYQFAIQEIKKLTLNSTYLGLIDRYSEVKYRLGQYQESLALLEMVEHSPILLSRDHFVGNHHFQKGKVLLKMGRIQDCITSFKIAHNTFGNQTLSYADNLNYLSLAYFKLGQKDSAYHYLKSYASFKDTINPQSVYLHIENVEKQLLRQDSTYMAIDNGSTTKSFNSLKNWGLISFTLLIIGSIYYNLKRRTQATKQLNEELVKENIIGAKDKTTVPDEFWNSVQNVLDKHLVNSEFNATVFAQEMYMSRMQLHRKLKKRTQLSTSIFIRNERIKKSLDLLNGSDRTIAEVAYDVGFTDPSFFSKSFKEIMSVTPTQYRERESYKRLYSH